MMKTAAVIASALVLVAPAFAQDAPVRVRGTIAAVAGATLTIKTSGGIDIALRLAPDARVIAARKASLADIKPGTYVGIANTGADGAQDALEVHIFPDAMRGAGEGQRAWDLGAKSRMTNDAVGKKVEAYDGQTLTLAYKGGESAIQVRPNTPVVAYAPGTRAELAPGAAAFVRDGRRAADGSIEASSIVVGVDGTRLGM